MIFARSNQILIFKTTGEHFKSYLWTGNINRKKPGQVPSVQNSVDDDDDGFLVNSLYEYKAAILWKKCIIPAPTLLIPDYIIRLFEY